MDYFLGQILLVPYYFAPMGWAFCNGALLPISQYTALYSLIGTTYGGDGQTNFALPDLRGRVPLGAGSGPGLSPYTLGERSGAEQVSVNPAQLPPHAHAASTQSASESNPTGANPGFTAIYNSGPNAVLQASGGTGGPHDNRQPYQSLNYIICMAGTYPTRS